jgi:hypothetical protein
MEKDFLPYELSLKMKQLGFDEPCLGWMADWNKQSHLGKHEPSHHHKSSCNAITWQSAFRWFREKYQLHSTITSISQESWQWHITKPGESLGKMYQEDFYTYEEAELECLKKLIQIIENK